MNNRNLFYGALIGAVTGLVAASLLNRRAEKNEAATALTTGEGIKIGMLRPITLWPFPAPRLRELAESVKGILVVELSTGQMVDDVRLAVDGKTPVRLFGRVGGNVPTAEEIKDHIVKLREVTQ